MSNDYIKNIIFLVSFLRIWVNNHLIKYNEKIMPKNQSKAFPIDFLGFGFDKEK